MKKLFKYVVCFLETAATARAATALTRMGRWRDAQTLMSK